MEKVTLSFGLYGGRSGPDYPGIRATISENVVKVSSPYNR